MKKVYAVLGMLSLAACSGSGSEDDGVVFSDTVTLSENQYIIESAEITNEAQFQVVASKTEGPAVEVFMLDAEGYEDWQYIVAEGSYANGQLDSIATLSVSPLDGQFESDWVSLTAGTYYFLIENTYFGSTEPPSNGVENEAVVEYTVSKQ